MGFFSKQENEEESLLGKGLKTTDNIEAPGLNKTTVAVNTNIGGDIDNDGDIDIYGVANGSVKSKKGNVIVYVSGTVVGNVEAEGNVIIHGIVKGDIKAGGAVILEKTSGVSGAIMCSSLQIKELAKYGGHCAVSPKEEKAEEKEESDLSDEIAE